MSFQQTLISERKKQGMSLAKLSEESGVPITTIAHYEKGVVPTIEKADRILRALGVTMFLGMQD